MDRVILHCDLNNFYASVECLYHPELREFPVAVRGDTDQRHGIVLAKNQIARSFGVKTGEVIYQAMDKCPKLITIRPNMALYQKFSRLVNDDYRRYSDRIQPFSIDESWIDLTHGVPPLRKGFKRPRKFVVPSVRSWALPFPSEFPLIKSSPNWAATYKNPMP